MPRRLVVLLLLLAWHSAPAADKTIDRRTHSDPHDSHFLVFCARGGSLVGHAFVVWGREDERLAASVSQAYGFYPDNGRKVFGFVPAGIRDEALRGSLSLITDRLIVKVDREPFERSQGAIARWQTRSYDLLLRNCISFTRDVASVVGLRVPPRAPAELPSDYVKALISAN